jgi:hypothetical protein
MLDQRAEPLQKMKKTQCLKNRAISISVAGEVAERVGFGEHPDRIDFWPLGKHVLASAFLNKTWRSDMSYVGGVFGSRTHKN